MVYETPQSWTILQALHDVVVLYFHDMMLGENNELQHSIYGINICAFVFIRNMYILEICVRNIQDMKYIYIRHRKI